MTPKPKAELPEGSIKVWRVSDSQGTAYREFGPKDPLAEWLPGIWLSLESLRAHEKKIAREAFEAASELLPTASGPHKWDVKYKSADDYIKEQFDGK